MSTMLPPSEVIPHRPPFLLIDEVIEISERHIVARRTFRAEEDFFRGHFPGRPIVPGVLLVEAMAQAFAYLAMQEKATRGVYLTGIDRARFRKPVLPGQTVELRVEVEAARMGVVKCKAVASVDGARVADAQLSGFSDRSDKG